MTNRSVNATDSGWVIEPEAPGIQYKGCMGWNHMSPSIPASFDEP